VVGAEFFQLATLFFAAGAGEDFRARHFGELHAGDADAPLAPRIRTFSPAFT